MLHIRIHTIDLLEQGIAALQALGYQIRVESEIGRSVICHLKDKPWLILDPNQAPREQLQVVLAGLQSELTKTPQLQLSVELHTVLEYQAHAA